MVPILVTGGAGFIGSHTAKLLSQSGYTAITYDDLSVGHRWAVQGRPLIVGNLSDRELLTRVMREHRVQGVIHFAASALVGESMANPGKYFQNNVVNTLALLDAMRDAGVRQIVFSSTCATYGTPESLPITEDHRQRPTNPYGESKLFNEKALRWYEKAHGMDWVALRYFNAAGADPDGELGEEHDPETHLIPLVIQTAMGRRPYLSVNGTDYPTPDGTAVRDFIHVTDLASAHLKALRYLNAGGSSRAFNLGAGRGYSVLQVVETVRKVTGADILAQEMPRRAGDPPQLVAAAKLAEQVLDWRPIYSDLNFIVSSAWKWYSAGSAAIRPTQVALQDEVITAARVASAGD